MEEVMKKVTQALESEKENTSLLTKQSTLSKGLKRKLL